MKKSILIFIFVVSFLSVIFSAELNLVDKGNLNISYKLLNNELLKIIFIDVDQADAILIMTPKNKVFLIDAGVWGSGEFVVLPLLKKLKINHIDKLLISHPHADHHGGAIYLLNNIKIKELYDAGLPIDEERYKQILNLCV